MPRNQNWTTPSGNAHARIRDLREATQTWKATTDSKHDMPRAPNLVARRWDAIATAPNRLWVSDLTYIWTWQGWAYLCVFLYIVLAPHTTKPAEVVYTRRTITALTKLHQSWIR